MGVEQVFVDYFQRAKEYDSKWKEYNSLPRRERSRTNPPRYDVEMKVLNNGSDAPIAFDCA